MRKTTAIGLLGFMMAAGFVFQALHQRASAAAGTGETELEGKWVLQGSDMTFVFSGDKFEITSQSVWYKGTFSLAPDADPKEIDLLIKDAPMPQFKGQTSLGIYEFQEGILWLAMNRPGLAERPTQFQPGGDIQVFRLQKAE